YFLTFWGEERIPHEAGHHAHESPPVMLWPLMILAVGAVGVGLVFGPTHLFEHFLEQHWSEAAPSPRPSAARGHRTRGGAPRCCWVAACPPWAAAPWPGRCTCASRNCPGRWRRRRRSPTSCRATASTWTSCTPPSWCCRCGCWRCSAG